MAVRRFRLIPLLILGAFATGVRCEEKAGEENDAAADWVLFKQAYNAIHDQLDAKDALVPLVILGQAPGHEIEHPTAVVIVGGLVSSTLLNLFVVPPLYLWVGRRRRRAPVSA